MSGSIAGLLRHFPHPIIVRPDFPIMTWLFLKAKLKAGCSSLPGNLAVPWHDPGTEADPEHSGGMMPLCLHWEHIDLALQGKSNQFL